MCYYLAPRRLRPDYLTRGVDGEIYSIHPVGLPLVLTPVYPLGGFTVVRLFLAAVSSGALALVAWPEATFGGDAQTHPLRLIAGLPGLLIDQEYGVIPNGPIYLLALIGLFHFTVEPPLTAADEGPEAELLYGHRLALVGGRYDVEMQLTRAPTTTLSGRLSVMVGRIGNPFETWEVSVSGHETWKQSLELATDAGYVGFSTTAELAAARPRIVVRPSGVTDAHRRYNKTQVFATFRTDTTAFYFLDPDIWPEPTRFWTHGGRHTEFLMAPRRAVDKSATSARFSLFCGLVSNTDHVASGDGRQTASLAPDSRHQFAVPASHGSALVGLMVTDGFAPAELTPGNDDTRYLGCLVESVLWAP